MVTAEFAVVVLAVLPVLLSVFALTALTAAHIKAVEAARSAARVLARGESEEQARRIVEQVLPRGQVDISTGPDGARVVVSQEFDGFTVLPAFTVRGVAVTPLETAYAP